MHLKGRYLEIDGRGTQVALLQYDLPSFQPQPPRPQVDGAQSTGTSEGTALTSTHQLNPAPAWPPILQYYPGSLVPSTTKGHRGYPTTTERSHALTSDPGGLLNFEVVPLELNPPRPVFRCRSPTVIFCSYTLLVPIRVRWRGLCKLAGIPEDSHRLRRLSSAMEMVEHTGRVS